MTRSPSADRSLRTRCLSVLLLVLATVASATSAVADTPLLPAAPPAVNGYLRPRVVNAASNLRVQCDLDLGDQTVSFSRSLSSEYGTRTLTLSGLERRGRQWRYVSSDRTVRLTITDPRPHSSHARLALTVRDWTDTLPAVAGGRAFHLRLTRGAFDVEAGVTLANGTLFRLMRDTSTGPPLAITKVVATIGTAGEDTLSATYDFPSDGVVPPTAPTVTLRTGEPGNVWEVCLPTTDHSVVRTSKGYRYIGLDPDGQGPLTVSGAWFVEVDYVLRRVRVRGVDLGAFPANTAPLYIALGFDGVENAVQVWTENVDRVRLLYR